MQWYVPEKHSQNDSVLLFCSITPAVVLLPSLYLFSLYMIEQSSCIPTLSVLCLESS